MSVNRFSEIAATTPVAVGGVGGSGTRLVAQILLSLGFYLGDDLNLAFDNLWFTLLFKHQGILSATNRQFENIVEIFISCMLDKNTFSQSQIDTITRLASTVRPQHSTEWLSRRVGTLTSRRGSNNRDLWGWKEPNTHIVIERLQEAIPDLKYIHVMRNGLDMAYSKNQNQLVMWRKYFIGGECYISTRDSLKFW